jgi:hypothetical protein
MNMKSLGLKSLGLKSLGLIALMPASLMILAADPPGAQAQTFNGFGSSSQYDQGFNPSVSTYEGTVVEVHNGTAAAGPLWYRVGKVNGSTVDWNGSHQYDNFGFNPSVAITGNTVVEVHNGGSGVGPLWYRTGTVNGSTINWSESHQYDNSGLDPSVAVAGNAVVEVHNGGAGVGPLWYRMGTLSGTSLSWNDSRKFDSYSTNPTVAAYPCTKLVGNPVTVSSCGVEVVEVHNDNGAPGPLWYRYGHSNDGSTIDWRTAVIYDAGWNPKISWAGGLLEVHNAQAGVVGPMWYHTATFLGAEDNPAVKFDPSLRYDNGNNPSVAVNPIGCPAAIEVHNGGAGFGPEWYHVGTFTCAIIQLQK